MNHCNCPQCQTDKLRGFYDEIVKELGDDLVLQKIATLTHERDQLLASSATFQRLCEEAQALAKTAMDERDEALVLLERTNQQLSERREFEPNP